MSKRLFGSELVLIDEVHKMCNRVFLGSKFWGALASSDELCKEIAEFIANAPPKLKPRSNTVNRMYVCCGYDLTGAVLRAGRNGFNRDTWKKLAGNFALFQEVGAFLITAPPYCHEVLVSYEGEINVQDVDDPDWKIKTLQTDRSGTHTCRMGLFMPKFEETIKEIGARMRKEGFEHADAYQLRAFVQQAKTMPRPWCMDPEFIGALKTAYPLNDGQILYPHFEKYTGNSTLLTGRHLVSKIESKFVLGVERQ